MTFGKSFDWNNGIFALIEGDIENDEFVTMLKVRNDGTYHTFEDGNIMTTIISTESNFTKTNLILEL